MVNGAATVTVVESETRGCDAEAFVNDIPATRAIWPGWSQQQRTVNPLLVGTNHELRLVIFPGPTPARALERQPRRRLHGDASARVRLANYPVGTFPGDADAIELTHIGWNGKDGDWIEPPIQLEQSFRSPAADEKQWQSAKLLSLDAQTHAAVLSVLRELAQSLGRADAEPYLRLAEQRMREVGESLAMSAEETMDEFRNSLARQAAKPDWQLVDPATLPLSLRLCGNGRLVDCVCDDWLPALRNPTGAVRYSVMLGQIASAWRILL